MIAGVVVKELVTHSDERGYFREIIRVTDDFFSEGFGQLGHALVYQGVAKAWHLHKRQIDWWYVASGLFQAVLHDTRASSPTYRETMELLLGDNHPARAVRIPQGVAHGYRCLVGPAHMIYVTSHTYDPADELRLPYDDPQIGYDWLSGTAIK